uniref:Ovule protein n=1 Tax=Romanomermis culicivorax TaxID=13658 RepID=A0A915KCC6_ROMCU
MFLSHFASKSVKISSISLSRSSLSSSWFNFRLLKFQLACKILTLGAKWTVEKKQKIPAIHTLKRCE